MGIIKYYNFDFCEVFIFDEFIINQVKESVVIEPEHNDLLNEIVQQHFSGKNMAYISNRVKSYSVNPLIYPEAEKIPNMIAIAIIPKTALMRRNAEYEQQFYKKPYEIYGSLSEAIAWVHSIISDLKKSPDHVKSKPQDHWHVVVFKEFPSVTINKTRKNQVIPSSINAGFMISKPVGGHRDLNEVNGVLGIAIHCSAYSVIMNGPFADGKFEVGKKQRASSSEKREQ